MLITATFLFQFTDYFLHMRLQSIVLATHFIPLLEFDLDVSHLVSNVGLQFIDLSCVLRVLLLLTLCLMTQL
jgi:hypothetical protein